MRNLGADLRFAIRQLRRAPVFTAAALTCLALGIGATSAIFSVVNAVVLRPLPYKDSQSLMRVYSEWPTWTGGGMWRFWISPPEFDALRRDNNAFETLDAWQPGGVNLSPSGRDPVRVNGASVTGTLFQTLGVAPLRGRTFTEADTQEGAPPTVVLSYGLWQGAFGGEPGALGRQVLLDGAKATVIGVMPRGFEFPPGDSEPAELWAPLAFSAADLSRWGNHRLSLLARRKPGVTPAQASTDLDRLEQAYGEQDGPRRHRFNPQTHTLAAFPLLEETVGDVRPAMLLMLGATFLVLLIACGNVANLLLARAQTRQREVALRQAMGASTAGLLRQFLIEGVLLSLGGAALGLVLAFVLLRLILRAGGDNIPRAAEVHLDGSVLLVALAAALATGVVFALAPLAQTVRTRLFETLKSAGGRTTPTREAHWLRSALVAGEIGLALMLLAGAAILVEGFWRLTHTDPGIRTEGVLSMRISLSAQDYPDLAARRRFWTAALERVRQLPGVASASVVAALPPNRPVDANDTFIEGLVPKPGGPIHNVDYWNSASPGSFELLGVPAVEGRTFEARDGDGAPPVLVVNQSFARHFYGEASAIGKRVKPDGRPSDDSPWFTIVGVVRDIKNQGLDRPAGPELFFSFPQAPNSRSATLLVKSQSVDPWPVLGPVRDALRGIDASLPLAQVRPLEDAIATARARPRFLALLLGLFAAVALGLAATGIFSVMTYAVAQRTSEFGIRMALGAESTQVIWLVLRQGMRLVLTGLAVGAVLGGILARTLRGLFAAGLGEFHWAPLAATVAILTAVTLGACWAPARRATRVDPVASLRAD
ncbi:MAG: ABC transporter permease [Bryobacteraceae bacterium]